MTPLTSHPSVTLLPEGAVFLKHSSTLVVADLHLGKSATFRARGLPVPEGDNDRDLARLASLVTRHAARHLVVAGDLFHAPAGITPELESSLAAFLANIAIPLTLVIGNHDAKIPRLPAHLHPAPQLDPEPGIRILHDPTEVATSALHLTGHWHPVVRIPDGRRTSLRLPCFLLRGNTLVLPSFGGFTGGAILKPTPTDRIFTALRDKVVEVPEELLRS